MPDPITNPITPLMSNRGFWLEIRTPPHIMEEGGGIKNSSCPRIAPPMIARLREHNNAPRLFLAHFLKNTNPITTIISQTNILSSPENTIPYPATPIASQTFVRSAIQEISFKNKIIAQTWRGNAAATKICHSSSFSNRVFFLQVSKAFLTFPVIFPDPHR